MIKSNYTAGDFKRNSSGYEGILDDYWTALVRSFLSQDASLARFFEHPDYSDIQLSVAGKSDGPDVPALRTLNSAMSEIDRHLHNLVDTYGPLSTEHGWWHFTSIWVPYQQTSMWYMHFTSDYGSDREFCWIHDDETGGYTCVPDGSWAAEAPLARAPSATKYVLSELRKCPSGHQHVATIDEIIKQTKTMGSDLVQPLRKAVNASRKELPEYMFVHLLNILDQASQTPSTPLSDVQE